MKLEIFKRLYKKFNNFPLSKELANSVEYEEYLEAAYSDELCKEWFLQQKVKEARINYKRFCCVTMAYNLIEDKLRNVEGNFDRIITFNKADKNFGIPIHDGGSSFIKIDFCPWCGKNLSLYPIVKKRKTN